MMLLIPIYVIITALPPAMLLCLCSLLAIWLAIGRTHIFMRMPLFLLGTLPLGLLLCLGAADGEACFAYCIGAIVMGASLPRTHLAIQLPTFVVGAAILVSLPYHVDANSLDSSWIVRVTLATSFVALVLATCRWIGFRLVDLTGGIPGLELEQATGRDLDQWISYFDAAGARALNHAEIMAKLREYGLSFAWQKTVTVAYLTALGRRPIGRTSNGRLELVVEHETRGLVDRLTRSTGQQFSIWQMMIATFCIATLLGFVRNFTWPTPTAIDFKYGIPLTLAVATTTFVAVWACLASRSGRGKTRIAWLAAMTVSVGVPLLMGFHTVSNPLVLVVIAAMFGHGALLIGLLSHARYRGYRLVCVQPLERPGLAALPAASDVSYR